MCTRRTTRLLFRTVGHRVVFKEWKCSVPSPRCIKHRSTVRESSKFTGNYFLLVKLNIRISYLDFDSRVRNERVIVINNAWFQLIPKLNANIMNEIERILDNKPSRPPMISTLALRWQSICPHGSGGGSLEDGGSPKSEGANSQDQEQTKELTGKLPFCEIQWSHISTCT